VGHKNGVVNRSFLSLSNIYNINAFNNNNNNNNTWPLAFLGKNMVSKSQVQVQTSGERKSDGRTECTKSGETLVYYYCNAFSKPIIRQN